MLQGEENITPFGLASLLTQNSSMSTTVDSAIPLYIPVLQPALNFMDIKATSQEFPVTAFQVSSQDTLENPIHHWQLSQPQQLQQLQQLQPWLTLATPLDLNDIRFEISQQDQYCQNQHGMLHTKRQMLWEKQWQLQEDVFSGPELHECIPTFRHDKYREAQLSPSAIQRSQSLYGQEQSLSHPPDSFSVSVAYIPNPNSIDCSTELVKSDAIRSDKSLLPQLNAATIYDQQILKSSKGRCRNDPIATGSSHQLFTAETVTVPTKTSRALSSPSSCTSSSISSESILTNRDHSRRRRLTIDETEYLLDQFYLNEKPTTKDRQKIADHLKLDQRTIQVWFQNRRAKLKRDESIVQESFIQQVENHVDQSPNSLSKGQTKERDEGEDDKERGGSSQRSCPNDNKNLVVPDKSLHKKSGPNFGTEVFLGYEHPQFESPDPWLTDNFEGILQQYVHADPITAPSTPMIGISVSHNEQRTVNANEESDEDIDYFNMATLNSENSLEMNILSLQQADENLLGLAFEPLNSGDGESTLDQLVNLNSGSTKALSYTTINQTCTLSAAEPQTSKRQDLRLTQLRRAEDKRFNGCHGSKVTSSLTPTSQESSTVSSEGRSPSLSMRSSAHTPRFMLRQQNLIPQHQMALTLILAREND
ncbi:hypothetical protein BX616_008871 [Lobosporangium transversale]|nr:hypothetical protein BX616_008871 [Lobosporangium transversale]